ncbi:MAG: site-2 protease family protein [Thermoanaerobaculia bacterium]
MKKKILTRAGRCASTLVRGLRCDGRYTGQGGGVAGFSVGFGPKLWSRRWGQVEYSLRWFPLGGFVDGGQILLSCLEEAFPRFARLRVPLTLLGLVFLAAVMVYANVGDVFRYLS